jgi:hypothetical protein
MSAEDIKHFLVVYDIAAGNADVTEYADYEEALERYDELEKQFLDSDEFDIVLLGADSLDTIKRTHSSYFETTEHGFERFFRDALQRR